MWRIEQQRYPYLRADVSGVPYSGRGVFYQGTQPLPAHSIVCTVLGQIRAMTDNHRDADHPLSLDLPGIDTSYSNPRFGECVYGLRVFPHTFAAIINSSRITPASAPDVQANCVFELHPHFAQHMDHYLHQGLYPSGALCVMVKEHCTLEPGQELFINYTWKAELHTVCPP
jgi:hypothetical protein